MRIVYCSGKALRVFSGIRATMNLRFIVRVLSWAQEDFPTLLEGLFFVDKMNGEERAIALFL